MKGGMNVGGHQGNYDFGSALTWWWSWRDSGFESGGVLMISIDNSRYQVGSSPAMWMFHVRCLTSSSPSFGSRLLAGCPLYGGPGQGPLLCRGGKVLMVHIPLSLHEQLRPHRGFVLRPGRASPACTAEVWRSLLGTGHGPLVARRAAQALAGGQQPVNGAVPGGGAGGRWPRWPLAGGLGGAYAWP